MMQENFGMGFDLNKICSDQFLYESGNGVTEEILGEINQTQVYLSQNTILNSLEQFDFFVASDREKSLVFLFCMTLTGYSYAHWSHNLVQFRLDFKDPNPEHRPYVKRDGQFVVNKGRSYMISAITKSHFRLLFSEFEDSKCSLSKEFLEQWHYEEVVRGDLEIEDSLGLTFFEYSQNDFLKKYLSRAEWKLFKSGDPVIRKELNNFTKLCWAFCHKLEANFRTSCLPSPYFPLQLKYLQQRQGTETAEVETLSAEEEKVHCYTLYHILHKVDLPVIWNGEYSKLQFLKDLDYLDLYFQNYNNGQFELKKN